ncbi:MAG: bifunctional methylenetetrahydrofolate dehydrogenase/methenyltetrahydrofolate cyclohydrolase FolD [Chloroflexi bacterium]|nr:bifunctional methylenetetrahydrofolate dehydrogenase/methenyltetrahydrofolate cyclohydrolase FolD [Chloroflexota bacterium]
MAPIVIDGNVVAAALREEIRVDVARFQTQYGYPAGLAVILVGEYPASVTYVRNKSRYSQELGMHSEVHQLPASTSEDEVLQLIDRLNRDARIHGFFVQMPVPAQIRPLHLQSAIDPAKDVDGLNPVNVGRLVLNEPCLTACTPLGVIELLKRYDLPVAGKHAVVLGRSNIVGKPMANLLLHANATVTICHSQTRNLAEITRQAEILVVAIGKTEMVTGEMVQAGTVVIDVGMNRIEDSSKKSGFRLTGDVKYDEVAPLAQAITPVPGGVGPMTIAMLLSNTIRAAWDSKKTG